jgi:hypothetical protein
MEPALQQASGVWEQCVPTALVVTELLGLWRVLLAAGISLAGQNVLHRTESTSTYWVLHNGGSRSTRLDIIARSLVVYCAMHGIHLSSEYVGAGVIIKSGADALHGMTMRLIACSTPGCTSACGACLEVLM